MSQPRQTQVTFAEALPVWIRVALLSFGGPAGQIAVMHRLLVEEKKWISERRFLHALNYCMLLPGPEAQQLATYIGWLMHGVRGGLTAGGLFVLPGFIAMMGLSLVYAEYHDTHALQALFFGLKAAVLVIVVEAVIRIGKRVLKNRVMLALAAAAFIGLFVFHLPFPLIIFTAAAIGFVGGRVWPKLFFVLQQHDEAQGDRSETLPPADEAAQHIRAAPWRTLLTMAVWGLLWAAPLVLVATWLGRDHVLYREGIFFSKAAMVTFGGAYAVLPYVGQEAVNTYGWISAAEMQDGLGMAETTPGPLIIVLQFVGYMGAYRHPGELAPLTSGVLGACMTVWTTFVPCFLWIFAGAPYVELLRGQKLLSAALSSVTAAVVGVILNLAVWFSLHTLFGTVNKWAYAGLEWEVPEWTSLNVGSLAIALLAAGLTFVAKQGMFVTLAVCTAAGAAIYFLFQV